MERLDDLLQEIDCRALLVLARSGKDPYLLPFCDAFDLAESLLVIPRRGSPRLGYFSPMERDEAASSGLDLLTPQDLDIARWARQRGASHAFLGHVASRALQLCELSPGRIAIAGRNDVGRAYGACRRLAEEGWTLEPGEEIVRRFRKRKSAAQLQVMRRAAAGVELAYHRVAERLAASRADDDGALWLEGEPLTSGRLRAEIDRLLLDHGLSSPEGRIVAAGEEAAVPHNHGDPQRRLRSGESLIVDLYPRSTLFVDCTRTFCVGEPPEVLRAAHEAVLEALHLARREARPGVRGWAVDERVCGFFSSLGHPTFLSHPEALDGYVHGLGHGVGFEVHEFPFFARRASEPEGRLEAGDVFTLEPGLYDPQAGYGVRLEDTYALGADGELENLFDLPYDLDPRAW